MTDAPKRGRPSVFSQEVAGMVEIYALVDPRTNETRYIGKAISSARRLKGHLRDAQRRDTPVYRWIKKLMTLGMVPLSHVIEVCPEGVWPQREVALILSARERGCRLLNVAEGGNQPFCSDEVRAENGRNVSKLRVSTPDKKRVYELNRRLGQELRRGTLPESLKVKMREAARKAPHLFGKWAAI